MPPHLTWHSNGDSDVLELGASAKVALCLGAKVMSRQVLILALPVDEVDLPFPASNCKYNCKRGIVKIQSHLALARYI